MTTALTEALAALEQVAGRIERLESQVARHSADNGRLRQEVAGVISELDQMIAGTPAGGTADHG